MLLIVVVTVAVSDLPPSARACPFCQGQGTTLTGEVKQAALVLYGTLANAKADPNDFSSGTTDLQIEAVIKNHEFLAGRKVLTLPRYVPEDKKSKFLVFCDVFKGKLDPYRGLAIQADSPMVKYLQGALTLPEKDQPARLRFFFDFLDTADVEISNDAFKEFANADYRDYRVMAKDLPADKLAGWLKDPSTPAFRYGLYASLLGHCGSAAHAAFLRSMLDDPEKRKNSGVDGILAGYTMLQPKKGWTYLRGIINETSNEFMLRYAGLRAVRFLVDYRPDLVEKKDLLDGYALLMEQPDIADFVIEDLRQRKLWDTSDRVLALFDKKSHQVPIIRRALLRYVLSCPKADAVAKARELREKDPETVKDAEALLKEPEAPPGAQPTK